MSTTVDYIIVGQGLAGSALAWELLRRGKRLIVFDEPAKNRASKISAGICNPVTGRVMTKTYLAEDLFPYLNRFYPEAEKDLKRKFFYPLPIYRPFLSTDEMIQWKAKVESDAVRQFVTHVQENPLDPDSLNNPFGGLVVGQSGYLDVAGWTSAVRDALKESQAYRDEQFVESELETGDVIRYREFTASKIIFCNGLAATQSSLFSWLPIRPLKGETLTVHMEFDTSRIISRGVYLVPGQERNVFVAGSTYKHAPFEEAPSGEALAQITSRLQALVRVPFQIVHQDWGIRPTVSDRRPLLGHHPENRNVVIFNGLGTKGVSLAPYFAKCLTDWMEERAVLPEEVNIYRFKPLYSK